MYSPELWTVSRADGRCHGNFLLPGNFLCPSKNTHSYCQTSNKFFTIIICFQESVIYYLCFLTASKNHFKWRICQIQRNKLSTCSNTRMQRSMKRAWLSGLMELKMIWGTGLVLMISACSPQISVHPPSSSELLFSPLHKGLPQLLPVVCCVSPWRFFLLTASYFLCLHKKT